jgi:hypothetical protein
LHDVILAIADDLATVDAWPLSEFGHESPKDAQEQAYGCERYPGW